MYVFVQEIGLIFTRTVRKFRFRWALRLCKIN